MDKIVNFNAIFIGDIMTHGNQIKAAYIKETDVYDFSHYFDNIKKYIDNADIAVCNVETTFGGGIPSGYPKFNTPDSLCQTIQRAGFDVAAVANNHSFDTGKAGIVRTKEILQKNGIRVIGTKKNINEHANCILEIKGIKVGFINYTYETAKKGGNKTLNNRMLDEESGLLLNSFCLETIEDDLSIIEKDVNYLKSQGAKIIIAYYHWGNEYERKSNVMQRFIAYRTAKMGVDAIIGSHAHVLQEQSKIEVVVNNKNKVVPVFYGMGNYIWGNPPMRGRDTVLNTILAQLDIFYNLDKDECCIETSYIPLFIGLQPKKFETIDLTTINTEEKRETFKSIYKYDCNNLIEEIKNTVDNEHTVIRNFDDIIEVKCGKKINIFENFLQEEEYEAFYSEDCLVASVLQNGEIIGNGVGYTGITAIRSDGSEENFIVRVIESGESKLPILINEFNRIRDIYVPEGLVSGIEFELPEEIKLCKNVAKAWKKMMLAARNEGVYLKIVSGLRSKKGQLIRKNNYAARFGEERAKRRYQDFGCSEHHLGIALDINGGTYNDKTTSKAVAIRWVQKNCEKFGFIARKLTATMANTAYVHLRYVEDTELSKYMCKKELTVERLLIDYDFHFNELQKSQQWKTAIKENNNPRILTLKDICDINDIEVPEEFRNIENRIVPQIILHDSVKIENGSVFFFDKNLAGEMRRCRNALRSGAVLAFAKEQIFDECGEPMPTIKVEDPLEACVKVGKYIRSLYKADTVCITGSAGKSTTTELCYHVLSSKFNTHTCTTLNNANSRIYTLKFIQELNELHEIYVQEVGGSFPQHIEKTAEMLRPNIAIVTNIAEAHLDLYGSFENIKKDKLSLLENRAKNGVGIVNIDNIYLSEWVKTADGKVITYSLNNKNADYYAENIEQQLDGLYLTVVERKTGVKVDIKVDIIGKHNAYNIIAAFIAGRCKGMSSNEIVEAMSKFHTKGIRQKLYHIGGYNLYVDCFSSVEESLVLSMKTLADMKIQKGAKKIAVIWELQRLGSQNEVIHKRVAKEVQNFDIDYILVFGKNGKILADELCKARNNVYHTSSYEEMVKWIDLLKRENDVFLFKGQHMQSATLVIDSVFGTECVLNSVGERRDNGLIFSYGNYTGVIMHSAAAIIDIQKLTLQNVEIPEYINDKPVIALNKRLFKGNGLVTLSVGNRLVSILEEAFAECKNLKSIKFGNNIRTLGDGAFRGCVSLETVVIPKGCMSIGENAFEGCNNLTYVFIPDTVKFIGKDAFKGCDKVEICYENDMKLGLNDI